ncbi:hypothetical protein HD554DRAFT_1984091, partial [Boletus coccyginus]
MPIFYKCCTLTCELFNLMIELYPSTTSAGLVKQLKCKLLLKGTVGLCGSINSMFKSTSKATVTDSHQQRLRELQGEILTIINEKGEIIAWISTSYESASTTINKVSSQHLFQMKANAKITELLMGIRCHHKVLSLSMPEMMVIDNCCQVHQAMESAFSKTDWIFNMWYFITRY